jgi:nucleoside-diphosphate-sugar epimerase
MKRVIVTGGSGYVGRQVVSILSDKKYDVLVLDKKPLKTSSNVSYKKIDLLSSKKLDEIFQKADFVIHLAAEVGGVSFANNFPATIISNNALIDLNCIRAASKAKVKKYVYISSSLVYEQSLKFPLVEKDTKNIPPPTLSYGLEKLFGESLCEAFFQEHALSYSVCRLFNVYGINSAGNRDPNGHVIPDLIKKVKDSTGEVEVWGKKGIRRNFTHVSDIAQGIVSTLESGDVNEVFNIADKNEYSIEDIVLILWKVLKKEGAPKLRYVKKNKKDVLRNFASVVKAKRLLNWQAKKTMAEGLYEMI